MLAEHVIALPAANTAAPRAVVLVLEIRSAMGPETTDAMDAVRRIVEMMSPWIVGERLLPLDENCWVNWGIMLIGPMLPVSNPQTRPPRDMSIVHHT